jgi:hypothetical protein
LTELVTGLVTGRATFRTDARGGEDGGDATCTEVAPPAADADGVTVRLAAAAAGA